MRIAFAEDDRRLRTSVARGRREAWCVVDQAATGAHMPGLIESNDYDAINVDVLTIRLRENPSSC
jgi:DNA-binding response OmpR family regulator